MNLKKTKWIIALTLVTLGLLIVLTTSLPQSTQYYVTVDEFFSRMNELQNHTLKVAGKVAMGSIEKKEENMEWRFKTEFNKKVLNVYYKGAMPDTFKEGADVVLTGKIDSTQTFIAKEVLAKCASRYEEKLKPKLQS